MAEKKKITRVMATANFRGTDGTVKMGEVKNFDQNTCLVLIGSGKAVNADDEAAVEAGKKIIAARKASAEGRAERAKETAAGKAKAAGGGISKAEFDAAVKAEVEAQLDEKVAAAVAAAVEAKAAEKDAGKKPAK